MGTQHSEELVVGDRVMRSDATEKSIPAFQNLRGTVIDAVPGRSYVYVRWDCDKGFPSTYCSRVIVKKAPPGE